MVDVRCERDCRLVANLVVLRLDNRLHSLLSALNKLFGGGSGGGGGGTAGAARADVRRLCFTAGPRRANDASCMGTRRVYSQH